MTHRIGKTGSFRLDRLFPGVGRINRSSGTTKVKEFQRRDQLLTELFEHAQLDALRAFKRGDVSIEELLEAKRQGRLTSAALVSDIALRANLWTKLDEIYPAVDRDQKTAHRYRVSVEGFKRKAQPIIGAGARVSDLERVDWLELQRQWGASAADWNHLRRMLSSALTQLLGDVYHPFRRAVVKAIPIAAEQSRTPDLTPEIFWRIVAAAPQHVQSAFVTLIATGMRVGEYLACTRDHLMPLTFAINVPGTKTDESAATVYVDESLWPWVLAGVPSPVGYKWLRDYWIRACVAVGAGRYVPTGKTRRVRKKLERGQVYTRVGHREQGETEREVTYVDEPITRYVGLRIHDLRHAFAQLASDAGESTARIQAALRHAGPEMTRRYEMQKARKDVAAAVGGALLKRA
jgi:integrase